MLEQRGGHHGDLGARHHRLQHVLRGVDAAGDRQVGPDVAVEDRDPVQAQEQLVAGSTGSAWRHLQLVEVEVRLVEAVEEHQPVRAGVVQVGGRGWRTQLKAGRA